LYALAGLITGSAAGVTKKFVPLTYVYYSIPLAVLAILIGGGLWALHTGEPFAAVRRAARMLTRPQGVAAALLYVSLSIHMCVFAPRRFSELRAQYLWTYLLMWPLLGNIVAGAVMSAGPIYYGLVTGDQSRFAGLVSYLGQCTPLMAGAADLWNSHLTGQATV